MAFRLESRIGLLERDSFTGIPLTHKFSVVGRRDVHAFVLPTVAYDLRRNRRALQDLVLKHQLGTKIIHPDVIHAETCPHTGAATFYCKRHWASTLHNFPL